MNEYGNVEYPPVDFDEVYNSIVVDKIYKKDDYGKPKEYEEFGIIITKKTPKSVWYILGDLKKQKIGDVIHNVWMPHTTEPKRTKLLREETIKKWFGQVDNRPCVGFKVKGLSSTWYFKTNSLADELILLDENLIIT